MGTYRVDVGGQSYHVDADTPEAAHAAVMQLTGGAQDQEGSALGDFAQNTAGTVDHLLRGATGGAYDYMGAAGRYIGDKAMGAAGMEGRGGQSFNDALRAQRADDSRFASAHPITAGASEIAGAVAPAVLAPEASIYQAAADAADAGLAKLPFQVPTWLRFGAQGAAGGATAGLASAQGQGGGLPTAGDAAKSTGVGTAAGFATGSVAPYIAKAVGWTLGKGADVAQGVVDKLPFQQPNVATRKVAENLARDNIDPATLAANRARLGPGANVVDAAGTFDPATGTWLGGRNVRMQADTLANMPGQTADTAERVLKPRAGQAATEFIGSVKNNLSPNDFYGQIDQLGAQKAASAAPKYAQAYADFPQLSTPYLSDLAQDPIIQAAAKQGQRGAQINALSNRQGYVPPGQPMFDLDADGNVIAKNPWSLQQWDSVKKGMDRMINNMRDSNGMLPKTQDVRDLVGLKNALVNHLDEMTTVDGNSIYQDARNAWAGPSALEDAMWSGRDFMRGDRELTIKQFNKFSPDEQQAFRDGVAREITGTVENTGTIPPRMKNLTNPENGTRKVLQQIMPADQFSNLINTVGGISRKAETARILGGSATAPRQASQADLGLDLGGAAIQGMHGNAPGALATAGRSILNWIKMPSEGARDEMGRMLLDPNAFDQTLTALQQRAQVPNYRLLSLMSPPPAVSGGLVSSLMVPSNQRP